MSSVGKIRTLQFALFAGMPVMFGAVYYINQGRGESIFNIFCSFTKLSFSLYWWILKFISAGPLRLPYCKESVELLKGYRPAMDKLGDPLTVEKIDVKDPFNVTDTNSLQVNNNWRVLKVYWMID